jgi:hypothetical protein
LLWKKQTTLAFNQTGIGIHFKNLIHIS